MPYTTVAYSESQDSAALINVAGIPDPHVAVAGDEITVPNGVANLAGVYAGGPGMTLARVRSPRMRLVADLDISPIDRAAVPSSNHPFTDLFDSPIPLEGGEPITFQAGEDSGGAERSRGVVFLSDGPVQPVTPGELRSVRFTAAITTTDNVWVNGSVTFDQELRGGDYQIVGLRVQSATLVAARLVIPGSPWRPGCLGFPNDSDLEVMRFRFGRAGIWGTFNANQPPTLDIMCAGVDAAQEGVIDLVRIGGVGA